MSAQELPPVARLIAADPALDRSREEVAFQTYGRAAEKVRTAGERLISAFEELAAQQDAITESRLGSVSPCFSTPVESAWATWRAGNKNALERGADRERAAAEDDVPGWVNPS